MNIVVVGGGTAGWLTAALLIKKHSAKHKITILESSKLGIIGVGESTTGMLTDILINDLTDDFGANLTEFIIETGSTLKFGNVLKNWTSDGKTFVGPLDGGFTEKEIPDSMFAYGLTRLPTEDLSLTTITGQMIRNDYSGTTEGYKFKNPMMNALQVDGTFVGRYFKKLCLKNSNTNYIDNEILDVNLNEHGNIKSLLLQDGSVLEGDLFIDCTGFSRVLVNKLNSKWVSYKDNLPVNTGMPFLMKYKDGDYPKPYVLAWAQNNGWLWQTSLMDRTGNGYVFDRNFVTVDQAQAEIELALGQPIEPIKILKFESGRQEKSWIKNCVSVGLSYAFLEPLEATSIHTTIIQIKAIVDEYLKDTIEDTMNIGSINLYNNRIGSLYDSLKEFLVMHYMGGRTDTEFWRYISSGATQTEFVKNLIETSKSRLPSYKDIPEHSGGANWGLWSHIMAGVGILKKEVVEKEFTLESLQLAKHNYQQFLHNSKLHFADDIPYNKFIDHYRNLRLTRN
jgi:tryptophan halogenase